VAGCCEYGDEPSGSGTTELVIFIIIIKAVFNDSHLQTYLVEYLKVAGCGIVDWFCVTCNTLSCLLL
jgi:hypothetical protein